MQALVNLLRRSKIILGMIALLLIGYGIYFFFAFSITTDNAYVMANIQPVAAEVSGKVDGVYVQNNEWVKKGVLLFSLDAKAYEIRLKQAKLSLESVQLQLTEAENILAAFKQQNMIRRYELQLAVDKMRVERAQAQLSVEIAQSQLQATQVYAQADGVISNLTLTKGALVQAYQPLFAFIHTDKWWIEANFKETDLASIKKGDKAKIRLRMYLGKKAYIGVAQDTNWAVGRSKTDTNTLLQQVPQENQWLLLPQRFPVLIEIKDPDPNFPLHVGASAYVTIE